MSLSKPKERTQRPAKKYIKFKGGDDDGYFSYYQKYEKSDKRYSETTKGENIEISIDGALILDGDLLTVTGFIKDRGYLYSNEVRSVDDALTVRIFGEKQPIANGNWEYVKSEVGDKAKFTKSVYLFLDGEIVNVQISGASLTSWFNDIESHPEMLTTHEIKVKEIKSDKNGNVKYKYCEFEFGDEFDPLEMNKAVEADKSLQEYLEKYLEPESSINSANYEPESKVKDWREFDSHKGKLGLLPIEEIKKQQTILEEINQTDSDEYSFLCAAMKEYQEAQKSWADKKNKSGKRLGDYNSDELKQAYELIMGKSPEHPSRFFIEAGYAKSQLDAPEEENDDIFF